MKAFGPRPGGLLTSWRPMCPRGLDGATRPWQIGGTNKEHRHTQRGGLSTPARPADKTAHQSPRDNSTITISAASRGRVVSPKLLALCLLVRLELGRGAVMRHGTPIHRHSTPDAARFLGRTNSGHWRPAVPRRCRSLELYASRRLVSVICWPSEPRTSSKGRPRAETSP